MNARVDSVDVVHVGNECVGEHTLMISGREIEGLGVSRPSKHYSLLWLII